MSWFKRLCMFCFGLCGVVSLVALSITWVGPWTTWARSMLEVQWYLITLEVLVCVAAVGALACVLVALFAPRNPKETIVGEVDGGTIVVTRHAIVSQVRHVIEDDGVCKASSVRVRVRKRGNVRVNVRVKPMRPIDVIAYGERLYKKLGEGLAQVCGDSVKSVNVVFTEAAQAEAAPAGVESEVEAAYQGEQQAAGGPAQQEQAEYSSQSQIISVRPDVLARGGHDDSQETEAAPAAEAVPETQVIDEETETVELFADVAEADETAADVVEAAGETTEAFFSGEDEGV